MNNIIIKNFNVPLTDVDEYTYRLKKIQCAKFFQEAFALYCKKYDVTAYDVIKQNLIWVLTNTNFEFMGETPFWSEEFSINIWFSEISRLKIYIDFEFVSKGIAFAKGDSISLLLNSETKRPINPSEILQHIPTNNKTVFDAHSKPIFKKYEKLFNESIYKFGILDVDFNHHVNNLIYSSIAFSTIPVEYLKKHALKEYRIKFKKECFFNDQVKCSIFKEGNKLYSSIVRLSDNEQVCEIEALFV